MDFLKTEVEFGEAESEGVPYRHSTVSNFLDEEEDDTDLAYGFSEVSTLGGEEFRLETAYVLRERN